MALVRVRPTQTREIILKRGGVLDLVARGRATGGVTGAGAGAGSVTGAGGGTGDGAVPDMAERFGDGAVPDMAERLGEPRLEPRLEPNATERTHWLKIFGLVFMGLSRKSTSA